MARKFKNILETVGNTPVVKINRLARPGVNLYAKIEASNPLGSVEDRLALGGIEAAERSGDLKPGQTVVEATSGNTGIGLAMVCAQKGYAGNHYGRDVQRRTTQAHALSWGEGGAHTGCAARHRDGDESG
jgi:cysteine synthase